MLDRNNLNRIKGILSARQGAEVPKFNSGAKFAQTNGRSFIYSRGDGVWFTDENLTMPYNGDFAGFSSTEYNPNTVKNPLYNPEQSQTGVPGNPTSTPVQTKVPGAPQVTPTSAVEQVAQNAAVTLKKEGPLSEEEFNNGTRIAPIELNQEAMNASLNKMGPIKQAELVGVGDIQQQRHAEIMQKEEKKTKALNTFGSLTSAALQGIGTVVGANQQASDSNTTKTIDSAYSTVAEGIKQAGPVGQVIGTAMQVGKVAGDLIQSLGGGTDQQTAADKWMDSALFSWNIGMINGFAGEKTQDFGMDTSAVEQVGGSYGGSVNAISEASEKAGKKYGLFSSKAREKANKAIDLARSQQRVMGNIADTAASQRLAVQSMGEQAGLAYALMTNGGYDQKYTYAAKQGGALEWNPMIELNWNPSIEVTWEPQVELNWELSEFKEGGTIDINEELEWIPELQSGNKIRTIEELIEYAKQKNPRFIQRLSEEPRGIKFTDDEGKEAEGSHYLESRGEYVIPRIQEVDGELQFFNRQDAFDRAIETGNYLEMTPEEAIIFAEQYKQGWPDFFKKFKEGGSLGDYDIPETEETNQKNVIPEGALHKNKHHMEHAEGLTKKGIPVIDGDGEQQAEIEHSEIIFTLEVTKKLEEYYKTFYSDESSNKEKEQAALDAGKLLVYQILENTEDRTGLIDSCKKGGTLTLKKSTDDLIEEALSEDVSVVVIEEHTEKRPIKKTKETSEKEQIKELIKEALIELILK